MVEISTITCPHCGQRSSERMPLDACVFFYECEGCGARIRPLPGDCCVFCSYGTVPYPSIQTGAHCGPASDDKAARMSEPSLQRVVFTERATS